MKCTTLSNSLILIPFQPLAHFTDSNKLMLLNLNTEPDINMFIHLLPIDYKLKKLTHISKSTNFFNSKLFENVLDFNILWQIK